MKCYSQNKSGLPSTNAQLRRRGTVQNISCKFRKDILLAIAALLLGSHCGEMGTSGGTFNEPAPSGTVVAQGTLESRNQKAVSGGASVYLQSSGTYVLRLEGISVPTTVTLQAVLYSNSTKYVQQLLKSSQGSMNYTFSVADASRPTWSYVSIFSPSENIDYGKAILIASSTAREGTFRFDTQPVLLRSEPLLSTTPETP